ncbi:hypothetical protein Rhopal_000307-T1 [Rhodotorula paludigena]|uniref:Uncharacterized protein n=1 Tax=Rhodotorula paludigena TaxID=86838 RepID=A0AAV5GB97_9BASI|nr:hypothetical protein Rhopal_000307-T1 [Rhodotorula paludigena]
MPPDMDDDFVVSDTEDESEDDGELTFDRSSMATSDTSPSPSSPRVKDEEDERDNVIDLTQDNGETAHTHSAAENGEEATQPRRSALRARKAIHHTDVDSEEEPDERARLNARKSGSEGKTRGGQDADDPLVRQLKEEEEDRKEEEKADKHRKAWKTRPKEYPWERITTHAELNLGLTQPGRLFAYCSSAGRWPMRNDCGNMHDVWTKLEAKGWRYFGRYEILWAGSPRDGAYTALPADKRARVHKIFLSYYKKKHSGFSRFLLEDCNITLDNGEVVPMRDARVTKAQASKRIDEALHANDGSLKAHFAVMRYLDCNMAEFMECKSRAPRPKKGENGQDRADGQTATGRRKKAAKGTGAQSKKRSARSVAPTPAPRPKREKRE